MPMQEVPRKDWEGFLRSYCREHEGWLASFVSPDRHASEPLPLMNIRLECTDAHDRIVLCFGKDGAEVAHAVPHPRAVRALRTDSGAHAGLDIESDDGDVTVLRFRAPAVPETLDGMAPGEHPPRRPKAA